MTYYWIGHSDAFVTTQFNDGEEAAISVALRSLVEALDRWVYCDYLMILISHTESNYGMGYIER